MIYRLLLPFVFCFLTAAAQIAVGGSFADENGNEQVVETTDFHPFWVVNKEAWVEAKDLREGDVFIGANGELSTLVEKERVAYPAGITVYNFTVDGNHDYFVIAQTAEYGQTSVLVHNAGYEKHHAVPKFLGSAEKQPLVHIPQNAHTELHKNLKASLQAEFGLPVGGMNGSRAKWLKYFDDHAGSQKRAYYDILSNISQDIDDRYGTNIILYIWEYFLWNLG